MPSTYEIPILSGEQNRAATAHQCVELLIYLDKVMDEIFGTIMKRIDETSKTVDDIKKRTDKAGETVKKLKGRTVATKVFSSAKYPGRKEYAPLKPLFTDEPKMQWNAPKKLYKPLPYDADALKEKLEFFHVRQRENKNNLKLSEAGLGKLPNDISSVSSLLLFNTSHNPYKKYKTIDPLSISSEPNVSQFNEESNSNIFDAPVTFLEGDQLADKDEFQYIPDLSALPTLDLPAELQTLTGIANDLLLESGTIVPIAPSALLPDYYLDEDDVEPVPPPPLSVIIPPPPPSSFTPLSPLPSVSTIPPPPPPPSVSTIPPPPPPPSISIPPPPPPPLQSTVPTPPPPVSIDQRDISKSVLKPVPMESPPDNRSDLLKAIQAAGGASKAKLRKVSQMESNELNKEVKTAPKGNDLMSDLFTKLSQRRKGISGPGQESKHSTMEKISSIIAPPPLRKETNSNQNSETDEEWDD